MKLDLEKIQLINLFDRLTRVNALDCFEYNNKLVFLVPEDKLFYALGKNGSNAERISKMVNKRIKVVAFGDDPVKFIKSFISPIKPEEVTLEENVIKIKVESVTDKAMLIGRNSKNIKSLSEMLKKYYKGIEKITVS